MTMFRNSRHRFSAVYPALNHEGEQYGYVEPRETSGVAAAGALTHFLKAGESLESLAFKYYQDSSKWYLIADANPEVFFPLDIEPGQQILIPSPAYAALA